MKQAFRVVQLGPNVQLPQDQLHRVDTFAGGLDLRDAAEDLQSGSSPSMDDMEVSKDDRLIRAPGVDEIEVLDQAPQQVLLHPGYHYSSALVFLKPPFVGVKSNGTTVWSNVGLPAGKYGWTDFAGVLLLSCGVGGTYYKEPDKPAISLIPGAPAALGLATFAGRVVLGGTLVAGNMDMMGIGWSDATSDYKGWDGDRGAGAESMIGSMRRADKFQGFGMLGFNLLAIVNRHSLWIATPTGDIFEPMAIVPKLEDTGATHGETVLPTEYGALFLSDDGVRIFDGNQSLVISEPISSQLLPIDETQHYTSSIDPGTKRYHLHTPTRTYIYDLAGKRWYRWPRTYLASVWFPEQGAPSPAWSGTSGSWGAQTLAWWQLDPQEFNGSMHYVRGSLLGVQSTGESDFGSAIVPIWFDRIEQGDNQDLLLTSQRLYLTYKSTGEATISLWLPDFNGNYSVVRTGISLPSTSGATGRIAVPFIYTGRGIGIGLQITSGSPRISKASVAFQPTSQL